jgi:hypothetical protein
VKHRSFKSHHAPRSHGVGCVPVVVCSASIQIQTGMHTTIGLGQEVQSSYPGNVKVRGPTISRIVLHNSDKDTVERSLHQVFHYSQIIIYMVVLRARDPVSSVCPAGSHGVDGSVGGSDDGSDVMMRGVLLWAPGYSLGVAQCREGARHGDHLLGTQCQGRIRPSYKPHNELIDLLHWAFHCHPPHPPHPMVIFNPS